MQYERDEVKNRVRNAIATLPPREQRVIALYYYNEVTMKDIGAELGVNESRVSQLHARAIRRLREALGAEITPVAASQALRDAIALIEAKPARMAKASLPESDTRVPQAAQRRAGQRALRGLMLESQLVGGRQEPSARPLVYGRSITDACLGWDDTERLALELADAL